MPLFVNHEAHALVAPGAAAAVVAAYALAFLAASASLRKAGGQSFMDAGQTEQLKGLAIILIVFGHLNRVLADGVRVPNFAGFGVAIFLFCSGYGLAASYLGRRFTLWEFISRRFSRIYLPYWAVVIAALAADYALLSIRYAPWEVAAGLAGLNVVPGVERMDYTRWFISYILLMYLFFFIAARAVSRRARLAALFLCALAMDAGLYAYCLARPFAPGSIYMGTVRHFIMYSLVFPAGCAVFAYRDKVAAAVKRLTASPWSLIAVAAAVACLFAAKTTLADPLRRLFDRQDINSVFAESALWQPAFVAAIALLMALMGALKRAGYRSGFLALAGSLSYEIYLLHSLLMVRYDFFLFRTPFLLYFLVYLAVVIALAYGLKAFLPSNKKTKADARAGL